MSTSKLPSRPSLDSLRKQAKKLAGDAEPPLSHREAQLALAREYGFAGWKDMVKEVQQRLGRGLEWAVSEARRIIHDNDVDGVRQLLADFPALLTWQADENDGGLLGMATGSFGDSGDDFREEHFTRRACAELLLDAGAIVPPSVCKGLIDSRARGLIDLFRRRGLFPQSLRFLAALGDLDGVRSWLDTHADEPGAVNDGFMYACHLGHADVAALLLDRSITLDPEMGRRIDGGPGRAGLIHYFLENKPDVHGPWPFRPWQAFVERQIERAIGERDLPAFVDGLRREAWLLSDAHVRFQVRLIERTAASLKDHSAFLQALLDLDPAVLHVSEPPPTHAYVHAFTYAQTRLIPMLLRIWPMPDDLPHAAGNGDIDGVRRWFDEAGRPTLGDLAKHFPANDAWIRGNLQWGEPTVQQVLDTALAWAVMSDHFEVAEFLLAHGADVNTNWSSHEPASILHELVWHKNYRAMQFLIDHGIDRTIVDYRWNSTARGWAAYAEKDEKLAQWLATSAPRDPNTPS